MNVLPEFELTCTDFLDEMIKSSNQENEKLIKKYAKRIYNNYSEICREQNEELKTLRLEIDALKGLLKTHPKIKNNIAECNDDLHEYSEKIKTVGENVYKCILEAEPNWGRYRQWHTSPVTSVRREYKVEFYNNMEEYVCMYPMQTSVMIIDLISMIMRLENELRVYDSHLNVYAEQIVKECFYNQYNSRGRMSYKCKYHPTGDCPMDFISDAISSKKPSVLKTYDDIEKNRGRAVSIKYPKIRVNGGE